jgi:hypothetical protein
LGHKIEGKNVGNIKHLCARSLSVELGILSENIFLYQALQQNTSVVLKIIFQIIALFLFEIGSVKGCYNLQKVIFCLQLNNYYFYKVQRQLGHNFGLIVKSKVVQKNLC